MKCAFNKTEHSQEGSSSAEMSIDVDSESSKGKGKILSDNCTGKALESELGSLTLKADPEGPDVAHNLLVELVDCMVDFQTGVPDPKQEVQQVVYTRSNLGTLDPCDMEQSSSLSNSFKEIKANGIPCSYIEMPIVAGTSEPGTSGVAMEGPSEEGSYHLNNNNWLTNDQSSHCTPMDPTCGILNDWGRCGMPPSFSWGGRVVGRRQVKGYVKGNSGVRGEDYDTFVNIFEGGSLLYCNMSFEALLNVRKQLEELGFPCKAVNDGLWLQVRSNIFFLPILYVFINVI